MTDKPLFYKWQTITQFYGVMSLRFEKGAHNLDMEEVMALWRASVTNGTTSIAIAAIEACFDDAARGDFAPRPLFATLFGLLVHPTCVDAALTKLRETDADQMTAHRRALEAFLGAVAPPPFSP